MKQWFFLFALFAGIYGFAQPINDEPCGAIILPVANSDNCTPNYGISWIGATESGIPYPLCNNSFITGKKDVWYKFIVPNSGSITINTAKGINVADYTMALYTAADCTSGFAGVMCDDDSGPDAYPAITYGGLTPNSTLYLRIWAWSSPVAGGELKICVSSLPLSNSNSNVGVGTNTPTANLDVNGTIRIRGGSPGTGKVLTTDAYGNASWSQKAFSSGWIQAVLNIAARDSVIDNTYVKYYSIAVPQLTEEVIQNKHYTTYMRVGNIGPVMLPYISEAGGITNQVFCKYSVGQVTIFRNTFNSHRFNGGIAERYPGEPVMVPLITGIEYRVVITE